MSTVVVALGGNAITREGQAGTYAEQLANARAMARAIGELRGAGWSVVVVHGNGPQVGNLAIQQETDRVPELPLHWLVAMTEGQLGCLLVLALREVGVPAVALVTHTVVDADDAGFAAPTKPIGPFLDEATARHHARERGWTVGSDAGRGHRRLVASPEPRRIVELDAVRAVADHGAVVVAAGGGGVPVVDDGGVLRGVDAVIDKDLAAAVLAGALGADALLLVTGVPQVMLDFGTPDAHAVARMTDAEAVAHAEAGQFPEGSMGPKVRAAVRFVRAAGDVAVITDAEHAVAALRPDGGGTRIVPTAGARPIPGEPADSPQGAAS